MKNKEKNFVSAVVYLGDEIDQVDGFLGMITSSFSARFEHYELVFVNDASRDGTPAKVKNYLGTLSEKPPVTMINMSLKQGLELAMNAGQDMAIGDFVYEFDTMHIPYPVQYIEDVYDTCLKGNDIVSVSPSKPRSASSSFFYKVFNGSSKSKYKLQTDVFRIISRRGINRVHSISDTMPYRKAAYAACGLKMATIFFDGEVGGTNDKLRFSRALDSLALYTDFAFKISVSISIIMLLIMFSAVVYTVVVFAFSGINPASGWTTTMLVMTAGFFGVFLVLSIVLKYLDLLVDLIFKKQKYLIESIEKIA